MRTDSHERRAFGCIVFCGMALAIIPPVAAAEVLPGSYLRLDLELRSEKPVVLDERFSDFQLPLMVHLGYEPGEPLRQFWFSRERVTVSVTEAQRKARSALVGTEAEAEAVAAAAAQAATAAEAANHRHLLPMTVQKRHLDVSKLTCDAKRVKGTIGYFWRNNPRLKPSYWAGGYLTVDLAVAGDGSVRGTFTRSVTTYLPGDDPRGPRKPSDPVTETGRVTGRVLRMAELQRRHRIVDGKDVTTFPGNVGGKGFPPYDGKLIQKVEDARLVWVSEDNTATAWRNCHINFGGGYAPPLLWKNRIYQYYFQPRPGGTVRSQGKEYPDSKEPTREMARKTIDAWSVAEAQEVVVCMDAASGATLWKRVMDFEGAMNFGLAGSKAGPFQVPCIADGKVFVQGTVGQLYCLDALTGKTIWEDNTAKFSGCKASSLQCVDGVLLAAGRRGLAGVDPKTGKQLWENRGGAGGGSHRGGTISVVPWTHDGKTYFLDERGLFDPKTGKQLWSFPEGAGMRFPTVCGDVALVQVSAKPGEKRACTSLRAFRISPAGCKELWAHPEGASLSRFCHPCVVSGRVYGKLDNTNGGSTGKYVKKTFSTDLRTGNTQLAGTSGAGNPFYTPNLCFGVANGLVMGNGSGFLRVLPEAPYMEPFGDLGYAWNNCMMPIYSDGRFFKRTNYGYIVCIDMRAEPEVIEVMSADFRGTGESP